MSCTIKEYMKEAGVSRATAFREFKEMKAKGYRPESVDEALEIMNRWPASHDMLHDFEYTTRPKTIDLDVYRTPEATQTLFFRKLAQGFLVEVGKWKRYKVYKYEPWPDGWTFEQQMRADKRALARAKRIREKHAESLSGRKVLDEGTASEVCG